MNVEILESKEKKFFHIKKTFIFDEPETCWIKVESFIYQSNKKYIHGTYEDGSVFFYDYHTNWGGGDLIGSSKNHGRQIFKAFASLRDSENRNERINNFWS